MTFFSNIQTECHNREDWEYVAEWASGTVEMETAKEFKNSPEAQRLANSDAILDYIAEAIKSLRDEKVPPQMPYFVASELTSLLCTKMWTEGNASVLSVNSHRFIACLRLTCTCSSSFPIRRSSPRRWRCL